jgi:hypothetical protein
MFLRSGISVLAALVTLTTGTLALGAHTQTGSCACGAPFARLGESPLSHPQFITEVTPDRVTSIDKKRLTELQGATIQMAATPGLTAEWLQRLVDESRSQSASTGPGSDWDPLALPAVTAEVRSSGAGFALLIRSDDRRTAKEILRRSEALVGR